MTLIACRLQYKGQSFTCGLFRTRMENLAGAIALMEKEFPDDFYSFDAGKLLKCGVQIDYYTSY